LLSDTHNYTKKKKSVLIREIGIRKKDKNFGGEHLFFDQSSPLEYILLFLFLSLFLFNFLSPSLTAWAHRYRETLSVSLISSELGFESLFCFQIVPIFGCDHLCLWYITFSFSFFLFYFFLGVGLYSVRYHCIIVGAVSRAIAVLSFFFFEVYFCLFCWVWSQSLVF
jgi:hypothetical protein